MSDNASNMMKAFTVLNDLSHATGTAAVESQIAHSANTATASAVCDTDDGFISYIDDPDLWNDLYLKRS